MARGREVRPALIMLLALCIAPLANAVVIDLGSYSVQDPKITVNYTEDVFLGSASLFNLDPDAIIKEYTLRQVPAKVQGQPTYLRVYYLYTGTAADPQYLISGKYQLTLLASDRQGKPTQDIVEFRITGMDIIMIKPPFGYSEAAPFDVIFETQTDGEDTPANCQYSKQGWNVSLVRIDAVGSYVTTHTIRDLAYTGALYVSCVERTGRETRKRFAIGIDATPPVITARALPSIVTNPSDRSSVIRVRTDDNSTCQFDGDAFPFEDPSLFTSYQQTHELRSYYTEITDSARREFVHDLVCTNLAGLGAETTITVVVHLGADPNETDSQCIDDFDCLDNKMCSNGICVPRDEQEECIDDLDCYLGDSCINSVCVGETDTCSNGFLDTPEEDIDCGGSCAPCVSCFSDDECPSGKMCGSNGICIPGRITPPPAPDNDDDGIPDDIDDDDDNDGILDIDDPAPFDPNLPKPTDWLAITLIIIGAFIMGGAGWFLYQHNQEKKTRFAQRSTSQAPMPRQFSPSTQQQSGPMQRAAQRTAPTQRQGADRSTERKRILSAFEGKTQQEAPRPTPQKKQPAPSKNDQEDDDEDVFEKLERIGKKK